MAAVRLGAAPLHEAGRLGAVLFQYPALVRAPADNRAARSRRCASACRDYRICVEFRSPGGWPRSATASARSTCSRSTGWCSCASMRPPGVRAAPASRPPNVSCSSSASTAGRTAPGGAHAHGRRALPLPVQHRGAGGAGAGSPSHGGGGAARRHLLMNNCYRDYSVRGAAELRDLLARYTGAAQQ